MLLGRSPSRARSSLRSPLALVLLATVGLSLWLGWQAAAAQRHHREAVRSTLQQYTAMAGWEMSRLSREGLDWYLHEVFDDIDRYRSDGDPADITRAMSVAAERHGCDCALLTEPLATFRIDVEQGRLTLYPDTFPPAFRDRLIPWVTAQQNVDGQRRRGLLYESDPDLEGGGLVVGYTLRYDRSGNLTTGFGFLTSGAGIGEIVGHWYENNSLLPPSMGQTEANDSLLRVRVTGPDNVVLFSNLDPSSGSPPLATGLSEVGSNLEFSELKIDIDIPPGAAPNLVMGGLPPPRTGLYLTLIAIVLAVGTFGLVQIRRERQLADLRDDFLSGVSHELRTPLAQIRMFAELLTSSRLRSEDDRDRASLVIDREARRLTHLVESVLHFNRLRRSSVEPVAPSTLDVGEAVADAVDAFGPLAAARGATISMALDPDAFVAAERSDLRQILVNLLDNALKYGPMGQKVQIGVVHLGDEIRIVVDDEGPGVPPAQRGRIWNPYVRLERDRRTPEPGTGIGLAVVASLVTRHGGHSSVTNNPAGGARFTVDFPAVAAPKVVPSAPTPAVGAGA